MLRRPNRHHVRRLPLAQAPGPVLPQRGQRGGHVHIGGDGRAARPFATAGAQACDARLRAWRPACVTPLLQLHARPSAWHEPRLTRVLPRPQEWCRANGAECLAMQPPGRNMRGKEAPLTTCASLAAALLPVVASRLLDVPYVVSAAPFFVGATGAANFFVRLVDGC